MSEKEIAEKINELKSFYNVRDTINILSMTLLQLMVEKNQKIAQNGTVSTYSLLYTASQAYFGGVLAPNGDIHFVPFSANRGQKVSLDGTVSTYSLLYTVAAAYAGAVVDPKGDIHFVSRNANRGQKISTLPATPFSPALCRSAYLNKF